jgi:hypothetical protein
VSFGGGGRAVRQRWVLSATVALAVAAAGGAAWFARRTAETVRDAYAAEWVAGMVVEHMRTNGGAWPRGWDDLRAPYESVAARAGRPWSFEQLRERVEVDWAADPARLADAPDGGPGPPFRVIWLRNGGDAHWQGREPNRVVLEHLRGQRFGQ